MRANPRPVITWLKDELPIEIDERTQQVEHLDGVCELIIHKPAVKDSGTYSCTAVNSIGSQTGTHRVEFVPHPSLPGSRRDSGLSVAGSVAESEGGKSDTGSKDGGEGKPAKAERPKKLPPSEQVSSGGGSRRAPPPTMEELLKASRSKLSFVTNLQNRVFPEGSRVKLSCVVQGPDPNVRWLLNEQPIVYSPRVRNLSRDGLVALEIQNCTQADSGEYRCIVRNTECGIESTCQLQIYSTKGTADLAPTFTRSLKGQSFIL